MLAIMRITPEMLRERLGLANVEVIGSMHAFGRIDLMVRTEGQELPEGAALPIVTCPRDTDGDGNCGRPMCPWCNFPQNGK